MLDLSGRHGRSGMKLLLINNQGKIVRCLDDVEKNLPADRPRFFALLDLLEILMEEAQEQEQRQSRGLPSYAQRVKAA